MVTNESQFKTLRNSEKLKILDDLISEPIDPHYASLFLRSLITRKVFISEYGYFGNDKNDSLYRSFILTNLETKETDLYIDILELSCYINYFDVKIIQNVKSRLLGRYNYLLKLGALDYVLNFRDEIDGQDYVKLNEFVLAKSRNSLVRSQAIINLLALNNKDKYLSKLLLELKKEKVPTLFYRVLNNLVDYSEIRIDNNVIIEIISILSTKKFDKRVIEEISEGLKSLLK